ncbi:MAG: hypothetical protein HYT77_06175 [Deltaproteobacteria bacterium]|nr:hypothetical protein [Deltaproteobacteria bacterium]
MTTTLQQALIKAGLVKKEQADRIQKAKVPARVHSSAKPKSVGFIERKHLHHIRTDCEACGKNSPDVEYYEHQNKSLARKWLCVQCADTHNILDTYRQTMQSSHAQSKLFRRQYGPTKVFK